MLGIVWLPPSMEYLDSGLSFSFVILAGSNVVT
jgi:hypothetical protein